MPFNSLISRADADALIPQEVSNEILKGVATMNPILSMAKKLPDMSRKQRRTPVLNALANAYFLSGDNSLKQTTELDWSNKYLDAEELAVIVPIPEAVLDDTEYDIWGEVKPQIVDALGLAVSQAIMYGTNLPATWNVNMGGAGLVAIATAASHVASIANFVDLYDAIMSESAAGLSDGLLMLLEADGFMCTGHLAHTSMRGRLRGLRDANGNPIFKSTVQARAAYELDGTPIEFPTDGSMVAASALDIAGDWKQLVWSMRQDITYKVLTEAVIQDGAGNIIFNLAQQDMVALRAVMRLAVALPNPKNRMNPTDATRCPFAILTA